MARRLTEKQVFLAAIGATPTVANAVDLKDKVSPQLKTENIDYKVLNGSMGSTKSVVVSDYLTYTASVSAFLKAHDGSTAPKLSTLLRMCGLSEAVDSQTGVVTYAPTSSEIGTGEIVHYIDGKKYVAHKASANLKIDFEVKQPAVATFDISGFAEPLSEEPNPSVDPFDSNAIFVVDSVQAITVSGAVLNVSKASFDLGNQIDEEYLIGAKEFVRSDFDPKITIEDREIKGDISHWSDFLAGNIKAIEILLSAGDRKFRFKADNARYIEVGESDDNGKGVVSRTFRLESGSGNDNFTITYE